MCQVENTPFEKTKAPIVCYKLLLIKSGRILSPYWDYEWKEGKVEELEINRFNEAKSEWSTIEKSVFHAFRNKETAVDYSKIFSMRYGGELVLAKMIIPPGANISRGIQQFAQKTKTIVSTKIKLVKIEKVLKRGEDET